MTRESMFKLSAMSDQQPPLTNSAIHVLVENFLLLFEVPDFDGRRDESP